MSELIRRQDAIDVVTRSYNYESERLTALQELPVITNTLIQRYPSKNPKELSWRK